MKALTIMTALSALSLDAMGASTAASPGTQAGVETGVRQTCLWPDGKLLWANADTLDCSFFSGQDVPNALYREPRQENPIVLF